MTSRSPAVEHALEHEPHTSEGWHRPWLAGSLVAATAALLVIGMLNLPRETARLPEIARRAMEIAVPKWGQNEVISEIVYGSRGWDTFGETFLLLAAVVSVVMLSRSPEPRHQYVGESSAGIDEQRQFDPKEGSPDRSESESRAAEEKEADEDEAPQNVDAEPLGTWAPERAVAMTVVVRVSARIAVVVLGVASIYLPALGYTPGGGFPGGAALVGVVILLYAAFGHRRVRTVVRPDVLEPIEMFGAAAVIVIGLLGLLFKGSAFANFLTLAEQGTIRAGGTNQLYSAAEFIEVATGLTIAIFALLGMRHDWAPDEDGDGHSDNGEDSGGESDGESS